MNLKRSNAGIDLKAPFDSFLFQIRVYFLEGWLLLTFALFCKLTDGRLEG